MVRVDFPIGSNHHHLRNAVDVQTVPPAWVPAHPMDALPYVFALGQGRRPTLLGSIHRQDPPRHILGRLTRHPVSENGPFTHARGRTGTGHQPHTPSTVSRPGRLQVAVGHHPHDIPPRLGRQHMAACLVRLTMQLRHLALVFPAQVPPRFGPPAPRLSKSHPHGEVQFIQAPLGGMAQAVHVPCGHPRPPRPSGLLQVVPPLIVLKFPGRTPAR